MINVLFLPVMTSLCDYLPMTNQLLLKMCLFCYHHSYRYIYTPEHYFTREYRIEFFLFICTQTCRLSTTTHAVIWLTMSHWIEFPITMDYQTTYRNWEKILPMRWKNVCRRWDPPSWFVFWAIFPAFNLLEDLEKKTGRVILPQLYIAEFIHHWDLSKSKVTRGSEEKEKEEEEEDRKTSDRHGHHQKRTKEKKRTNFTHHISYWKVWRRRD